MSTPVRINDYPGLGSKGDGKFLDAAAISGTLHVAWQGVHYTNKWASPPNADDTNIYYDAAPLAPQPTVQKVYALAGNASALRSGPKGQAGDLYYLHGDHNGSLVLVTDATGNEVGRVWYDPFGEIISHTLPLTLTDRLWTGAQRDATIGLYQAGAGWYDPYSTQSTYAGVSVPQAPAGLGWGGGTYLGALGEPTGSDLPGIVVVNAIKAGISWGVSKAAQGGLSAAYRAGFRHGVRPLTEQVFARQLMSPQEWLAPLLEAYERLAAQASDEASYMTIKLIQAEYLRSYAGHLDDIISALDDPANWKKVVVGYEHFVEEPTGWARAAGVLASESAEKWLDLGVGVGLDVLWQGTGDISKLVSGDLAGGQYVKRLLIAGGGSILSWAGGLALGPVGAIVTAIVYDVWGQPRLYERFNAYPKSQTVGPAESEPW